MIAFMTITQRATLGVAKGSTASGWAIERSDDTCSPAVQASRSGRKLQCPGWSLPPSTRERPMAIRSSIIVSTTFDIQGRRIREYKGVVRGLIVRAPTITQGILGGLK